MNNASFHVLSLIPKDRLLVGNPMIPEWMKIAYWDDVNPLLGDQLSKFQAVLGGGTPIPYEVLSATSLEMIQLVSAGYDRIDREAVVEKGLVVCNNPGANALAVAEHMLMMLLYFARRAGEAQAMVYNGQFSNARMDLMGPQLRNLSEMTIGIIGLGAIGQCFAELVRPFGSKILYYSRTRNASVEEKLGLLYSELDAIVQVADAVAVALPLTEQSYQLFDARLFALMKPTAILINVGRGGVVDHQALANALVTKQIYAAGLDVFDPEPLPPDHPLLLVDDEVRQRMLLSPHLAGLTQCAWATMIQNAIDNLVRHAIDQRPQHVLSFVNESTTTTHQIV